jgi:hypothetical protein
MTERVFAAVVLALCVVLFVRLLIGARRRHRLDASMRRVALAMRRAVASVRHWRSSRRAAAQAANDAIRRARGHDGEWDGNVYKPKSFRKPPRDKMH